MYNPYKLSYRFFNARNYVYSVLYVYDSEKDVLYEADNKESMIFINHSDPSQIPAKTIKLTVFDDMCAQCPARLSHNLFRYRGIEYCTKCSGRGINEDCIEAFTPVSISKTLDGIMMQGKMSPKSYLRCSAEDCPDLSYSNISIEEL